MSADVSIRLLSRDDAEQYQRLRLKSLQESPYAFYSTHDNEKGYTLKVFADHLAWAYHPPFLGYYGIFVGNQLVGYAQLSKTMLEKQQHVVFINNVYIDSAFQGKGLATKLLSSAIDRVCLSGTIERVFVSCTAKNKPAYHLYTKLGFRRYSVRAKAMKWNGEYDDEIEMVKVL